MYPSVDSTKIFGFIEEVRTNSVNNALNPFNDFSDIESLLLRVGEKPFQGRYLGID